MDTLLLALNAIKKFWILKTILLKKLKNIIFKFIKTVLTSDPKKGNQKPWSQPSIHAKKNVILAVVKTVVARLSKHRLRRVLKIKIMNNVFLDKHNLRRLKIVIYCHILLSFVRNHAESNLRWMQDLDRLAKIFFLFLFIFNLIKDLIMLWQLLYWKGCWSRHR